MLTHTRDKQLLHVKEAAAELDIHPSTVRRAIKSGRLEAVRLGHGGRYRVRRDALQAFLHPALRIEPNEREEAR